MMNYRILIALFGVVLPIATASYNPGYGHGGSSGIDELVQAASGHGHPGGSLTAAADMQPGPVESAKLSHIQAQLNALNASPTYNNLKNSESIAESLAESNLASNIRQGNVNVVAPNVVDQGVFRSLLVPSGRNNHQVIATKPLPPIIVNQPGAPPAHVNSGPAAVVKAAPVIYKIKPSVIYQQEVINKVPTPLSLNPVYVKVYKPGKKIEAPVAPVVAPVYNNPPAYGPSPAYGPASSSAAASDSYSPAAPIYPGSSAY